LKLSCGDEAGDIKLVASRAEAWVETGNDSLSGRSAGSRLPRGGVG